MVETLMETAGGKQGYMEADSVFCSKKKQNKKQKIVSYISSLVLLVRSQLHVT